MYFTYMYYTKFKCSKLVHYFFKKNVLINNYLVVIKCPVFNYLFGFIALDNSGYN